MFCLSSLSYHIVLAFLFASFEDGSNPYQLFHSVGEDDNLDRLFNYLSSRSSFLLFVEFPSHDAVGLLLSSTINLTVVTA